MSSANTIPAVPTFAPTPSPELDTLLLNFRRKVFTPAALAQPHRALIYKKKRHHIILNDLGVTVTLSNDEDIKLQPMEPREKPNKRKSLHRVAELLGEPENAEAWTNLPAFLEGLKMAKEEPPLWWMQKIARKANMTGKIGVIKLCAEMVKKTGATLANPLLTRELMLGYHMQAAAGNFQGEALEKALKSAEQIALMMEETLHCSGRLQPGHVDMRKSCFVLGVLLELTAYRAINIHNCVDVDGKVASLVTKTLACTREDGWGAQENDAALAGASAVKERATRGRNQRDYVLQEQYLLEGWVPLWNGMKVALEISSIAEGPNASSLRTTTEKLEESLRRVEKDVEEWSKGDRRRCLSLLKEIGARSS